MTLHPLQITAGVIVGVLVGGVAVYQVGHGPIDRIISDAVGSLRQLTHGDIAPPPPRIETGQQPRAADQAKAKALRDEQARQLRADQQKAGGSEALEAAARKERAWTKFYKKPPQCDGNPNTETMTECANDYIRAKRQFEQAYAAGKR